MDTVLRGFLLAIDFYLTLMAFEELMDFLLAGRGILVVLPVKFPFSEA
jgi:hypothetical protein